MVASILTSLPLASLNRERWLAREVVGGLLRGQAKRKQAGELARKNSNQDGRNALVGVSGNDCPRRRPIAVSGCSINLQVLVPRSRGFNWQDSKQARF